MGQKVRKSSGKRQRTEARIIEAFEKLLRTGGAENMGVNAIIEEAGVGKGALYDYFGGLEGLADAWVEHADFIPGMEEIAGEDLENFQQRSPADQIAQVHVNYATMLKDDALANQLMSEELMDESALSKPLQTIRRRIGESHESFFTKDPAFGNPDLVALIFILQAASNYLALRAQHSPNYNGVDISNEDGWDMLMGMISRVAALAEK